MNEIKPEKIIEERKEKLIRFLKNKNAWVFGLLIIAVILGVYLRSMPMQDHGGNPGLWDVTTNTWTLGPDLDPWLFTRYAKAIVEQGSLPANDTLRYFPLGFETAKETRLLPYMIAYTYKFFHIFNSELPVEFAGDIFPVIMFGLTIIAFFLFTREIFIDKGKTKANIIALIASFLMIVVPAFLSRTIAGIPEKESAAFFFMFLAFYLFLKAWKSESSKKAILFGVGAGISTGLMGLIWGGVLYVFITIALATLMSFILNKVNKIEFYVYCSWLFVSMISMVLLSQRFPLKDLFTSLDTGFAFLVFFIILVHFILWNTKLADMKFLQKIKLPKTIISIIVAILLGIIGVSILFGPGFITEKIKAINQMMFRPVTGRWNTTVAENRQPYFTEWGASFGPHIKNIPVLFWMFFVSSVILFKKMLNKIKNKHAWILTGLYVLFFFGLVFSRYAAHPSVFDGENFISKFIYYGFALLLAGYLIYSYIKYQKKGWGGFEEIKFEYLVLFSLFILCLFTARSAVRLIMVLAPVSVIFIGYLNVWGVNKFIKTKDGTAKVFFGAIAILIIILSLFAFSSFYKTTKAQAYNFIPSYYNQQWQKAMSWVRENTSQDAVFSHWWDYGYWVQSIGERATVSDGGNIVTYWNYLMGRHVLTGENEHKALEFLYNHDADYLLIDSSDIGKYGAFSSIGSNENLDRFSWIPVMVSDPKQIQENADGISRIYQGGAALDEDMLYNLNNESIFLPAGSAAVGGVILKYSGEGSQISFEQPQGAFFYQNKQYNIPIRYVYFNGQFKDFGAGLEASVRIIQNAESGQIDNLGALIYISPRVMRGYFAQKYLLDDPFNKFPNFKIAYTEPSLVVAQLRSQGVVVEDFVYYMGIQGPIKIWKINYTGREQFKEEYVDTDPSKYLSWEL